MNADAKSTDQIRMIAVRAIDRQLPICDERRARLGDRIAHLTERIDDIDHTQALSDLRVAIGELKTQLRVTWGLLTLVLSGLVGVAFAVWRNVI